MSDWQDSDPRSADAMADLDNRQTFVGRTLVFSDRFGPYKFMRNGAEVECICDDETMEQCAYHAGTDLAGWAKGDPL